MDFLKKFDLGRDGAVDPVIQQGSPQRADPPFGQHEVQLPQNHDDLLQEYPVPQGLAAAYFDGEFEAKGNWATGFENGGGVGQDIGFDQVLDPNKPEQVPPINTQDKFLEQAQQPGSHHSASAFPTSALFGGGASAFTPLTKLPGFADETQLAERSYAHADVDELEVSSDSSSDAGFGAESPKLSDGDDDSELLVQNFRNVYRDVPEGDPDSAPDSAQLSAEEPTENDGLLERLHRRIEDEVEEQVVEEVTDRFGEFGGELVEGYLDRED